jgi:hypothetical protein
MYSPEALGFTRYSYVKRTEVLVICPFHDDRHPSMSVNLESGLYHCFTCGASGGPKRLVTKTGGVLEEINELERPAVYEETKREALAQMLKAGKLIKKEHPYLAMRGVTMKQTLAYGLRDYGTSIGFPIYQDGECIGIQMRNISKYGLWRYRVVGEKPHLLRSMENSWSALIVTEGFFGMLNAERNLPAFSHATVLGASHDGNLWLRPGETAYCVFDADEAGLRCAARCLINTPNVMVCTPGAEADELNHDQWIEILNNRTSWPQELSKYSKDPHEFEHYVHVIASRKQNQRPVSLWW